MMIQDAHTTLLRPDEWPIPRGTTSWEAAYTHYRRLLLGALGRLAAHGYAVPPDEGMDLIHDFFLERWQRIVDSYDPERARFDTYLYGAFLGFARSHIVRRHRWQSSLSAPHNGEWRAGEPAINQVQELSSDTVAVHLATKKLSSSDRRLLAAYISDLGSSERELARHFDCSRHELRRRLADALGRTAVYLGEYSTFPEPDRSVLLALWRDGRSVRDTSRHLNLTTEDVQAVRTRVYRRLVEAVKERGRKHSMNPDQELGVTPHLAGPRPDSAHLLLALTRSEATEKDLDALRAEAESVISFLDSPAAESLFAQHADAFTPERLTLIYSALAREPDETAWRAELEPFLMATEQEEEAIGRAFSQTLVPSLPNALLEFSGRIFLGAAPLEEEEFQHLSTSPSVISGGPYAIEIARYGVTPTTILEASEAVANIARRQCDSLGIGMNHHLVLDASGRERTRSSPVLRRDDSIAEVEAVTELPRATAQRLFDWLAQVAQYTPSLFGGFYTELFGDELRMTRTDKIDSDLFTRWWTPPEPMVA